MNSTSARIALVVLGVALFFVALGAIVDDFAHAVDIAKTMIAILAAGCIFYEQRRRAIRRPVSERWKRFVGVTLGVAAIIAYFNAFKFKHPGYYHRWDQYHYYMGAKYFREMGY